ncbi:MAG: S-adenosylmethionine decarboxylase [Bacteroidota bacterium]
MFKTRSSELSLEVRPNPAGLHVISNFESDRQQLLTVCAPFKEFIDNAIVEHKLNKVGEAYHDFEGGGFTAVICLAESHLSIHTWPSYAKGSGKAQPGRGYVTFDIFLSNFTADNSPKAEAIYRDVLQFFNANVLFEKNIER